MLPCAAPKDVNPNLEGPSTNFMVVLSANVTMYRYYFYSNTILPATNIANSFSYSIDLEYTFKKFGIKYSYLIASQRPISQFGITNNLMYDWRIVSE